MIPIHGPIQIEMTQAGNIKVTLAKRAYYAMPIPPSAKDRTKMYGLFPDDRTWQERVAVNQPIQLQVHVGSGGSLVSQGKIVAKIPELGDEWVYDEALRWVAQSSHPAAITVAKKKEVN